MDVEIIHNHQPGSRPWRWQASPTAPPTAPSVPRSKSGFTDVEEAEQDAEKEGHAVVGVRE